VKHHLRPCGVDGAAGGGKIADVGAQVLDRPCQPGEVEQRRRRRRVQRQAGDLGAQGLSGGQVAYQLLITATTATTWVVAVRQFSTRRSADSPPRR